MKPGKLHVATSLAWKINRQDAKIAKEIFRGLISLGALTSPSACKIENSPEGQEGQEAVLPVFPRISAKRGHVSGLWPSLITKHFPRDESEDSFILIFPPSSSTANSPLFTAN